MTSARGTKSLIFSLQTKKQEFILTLDQAFGFILTQI